MKTREKCIAVEQKYLDLIMQDRLKHKECAAIPFALLIDAHAKLLGASLHAATHHEPISRLEDVKWAWHPGEGHSADKYRDILGKTTRENTKKQKSKNNRSMVKNVFVFFIKETVN